MKIIFNAIGLSLLLILPGCRKTSSESSHQERYVLVVNPTECSGTVSRQLSGKVQSDDIIKLGFKIGGEIEKINVKEGSKVKKGELLAKIDDSSYRIGRDAASAQYEQLKGEVGRIRELYARKSVSKNDYEKAEAGLKRAQAALNGEQIKLDYTSLIAPEDGEILSIYSHENEMTNAGTPVLTMLENGKLQVSIDLPSSLYNKLDKITAISCSCQEGEIPMNLMSVNPKADNNLLHPAILCFSGDCPTSVHPGSNVNICICFPSEQGKCMSIPVKSLFEENGLIYVWSVDSSMTVRKKEVITGELLLDGNIIVSGLDTSERIVRAGVHHLSEGEKVTIIEVSHVRNFNQAAEAVRP